MTAGAIAVLQIRQIAVVRVVRDVIALSSRLIKHFPPVKLPTCPPGALHRACRGKGAAVEKV